MKTLLQLMNIIYPIEYMEIRIINGKLKAARVIRRRIMMVVTRIVCLVRVHIRKVKGKVMLGLSVLPIRNIWNERKSLLGC